MHCDPPNFPPKFKFVNSICCSEDSLTTDALVRVLRDAIRCCELVPSPALNHNQISV